jgi:hypothetical protein
MELEPCNMAALGVTGPQASTGFRFNVYWRVGVSEDYIVLLQARGKIVRIVQI